MNTNFFTKHNETCSNHQIIYRDFEKGKSFNFSEWDPITLYTNDTFKQDFVTHNGVVYVCIKSNINCNPETCKDCWILAISGENLALNWMEFNIDGQMV